MHRFVPARSGNHPHEIVICFAMMFAGIVGLLTPTSISPAMNQVFPGGWDMAYFLGVLVAGTLTLTAILGTRSHPIEGRLIERIGLGLGALFIGAYVIAIYYNMGFSGLYAMVMPTVVVIANLWRIRHINNDLRAVTRWLKSTNGNPGKDDLRG